MVCCSILELALSRPGAVGNGKTIGRFYARLARYLTIRAIGKFQIPYAKNQYLFILDLFSIYPRSLPYLFPIYSQNIPEVFIFIHDLYIRFILNLFLIYLA